MPSQPNNPPLPTSPPHISQLVEILVTAQLYWVTEPGAWSDETVEFVTRHLPSKVGPGGWPPRPGPIPIPGYVIDDLVKNVRDPLRAGLTAPVGAPGP